jgi:nucleolar protein 56
MDEATSVFGEALRDQVEERLKFYEEGTVPRANEAVMKEALEKTTKMDIDEEEISPVKSDKDKKSKKKKSKAQEEETEASPPKKRKAEDDSKKSKKKKNKEKN